MDSDRGDMNQNHLCRQSPPNNQNLAEKISTFRIERVSLEVLKHVRKHAAASRRLNLLCLTCSAARELWMFSVVWHGFRSLDDMKSPITES